SQRGQRACAGSMQPPTAQTTRPSEPERSRPRRRPERSPRGTLTTRGALRVALCLLVVVVGLEAVALVAAVAERLAARAAAATERDARLGAVKLAPLAVHDPHRGLRAFLELDEVRPVRPHDDSYLCLLSHQSRPVFTHRAARRPANLGHRTP